MAPRQIAELVAGRVPAVVEKMAELFEIEVAALVMVQARKDLFEARLRTELNIHLSIRLH